MLRICHTWNSWDGSSLRIATFNRKHYFFPPQQKLSPTKRRIERGTASTINRLLMSLFVFKNHTIFIDVGKTISQPYGLMVYTTICGNHSCSAILFVFLEAAKNHVLEALRPAMWRCIGTNFHHHVACFLLKCQLDRENYWKQTKGWNLNLTRILRSVIVWVLFESWITPKCVGVSSCPS